MPLRRLKPLEARSDVLKDFIEKVKPVFLEFDKQYVGRGEVDWDIAVVIDDLTDADMREILLIMADNLEVFKGTTVYIGNNWITFEDKEDVAYVGDDMWVLDKIPLLREPRLLKYTMTVFLSKQLFNEKYGDPYIQFVLIKHREMNTFQTVLEYHGKGIMKVVKKVPKDIMR